MARRALIQVLFAVLLAASLTAPFLVYKSVGGGKRRASRLRSEEGSHSAAQALPVLSHNGDGTRWWRLTDEQQQALLKSSGGGAAANTIGVPSMRAPASTAKRRVGEGDRYEDATVLPTPTMLKHFPNNSKSQAEGTAGVLVGVFSNANQRRRRDSIRATWSHQAALADIALIFVIGDHTPRRLQHTSTPDLISARKEALEFGDVLFVKTRVSPSGDAGARDLPSSCMLFGTRQHDWPPSLHAATLALQGSAPDLLHTENQELTMLSAFYQLAAKYGASLDYVVKLTDGHQCWPCRLQSVLSRMLNTVRSAKGLYWGPAGDPLVGAVSRHRTCGGNGSGIGSTGFDDDRLVKGGAYAPYAGGAHIISKDVAMSLSRSLTPCFTMPSNVSRPYQQQSHRKQASYRHFVASSSDVPLQQLPSTFPYADLALPRLFHFMRSNVSLVADDPIAPSFPRFGTSSVRSELCALTDNRRVEPVLNANNDLNSKVNINATRACQVSTQTVPLPNFFRHRQHISHVRDRMGYYFSPVPDGTRILIGILSGPTTKSKKRRTDIRQTWLQHFTAKPSVNRFFRAYFLVGNSCDTQTQQRLLAEALAHGDIMLMPGCRESYHAISEKVVSLFHVAGTGIAPRSQRLLWLPRSVQHIVKADDDAFLRVDKLLDRLYQSQAIYSGSRSATASSPAGVTTNNAPPFLRPWPAFAHKLYMGNVMRNQPVVRDISNKRYYVSPEEYADETYPPYISGSGVVISRDVAAAINQISQAPSYVPFKFEDVNTGMLVSRIPLRARVPLTSTIEILGWGHEGPILPKEWFMMHYVNSYGWSMRKVMEHLKHPPPLSERPFLRRIDWDVPRGRSNLWQVGKNRAEAACRSDKGIAAGCAGWVVYKSIAYLKSTTEGAVQLKPGSGRVMFVRNPEFSGEGVVDRERDREQGQDKNPEQDVIISGGDEELELRAALRDGGRPANQSCAAHHRGGGANGGRDVLVTLTAGERHLDSVRDLMIHVRDVQMSGYRGASGSWAVTTKGHVDFLLLHWDMDEKDARHHEVAEAHAWWWHGVPGLFRVTHSYHRGFVKLDFARETLTPEMVCAYDFVFLWDSDVTLSPQHFSFLGFVAQMQQHGIDLASPTLDTESFASYHITRTRLGLSAVTGTSPRENWRIEVGFMVFATETFLSFRALLHRFPFKFWWVDTLPLQCILGARKVAFLDGMVVHHGDTKNHVNAREKTLKIDVTYTLKEKSWRTDAIAQYGCCPYMRGVKELYGKKEEKPEFFKCACDSGGLYC